MEERPSGGDEAGGNHEVDELAEGKGAEELVVGFYVLGDFVLGHVVIIISYGFWQLMWQEGES